jgi:hypothetical protein
MFYPYRGMIAILVDRLKDCFERLSEFLSWCQIVTTQKSAQLGQAARPNKAHVVLD